MDFQVIFVSGVIESCRVRGFEGPYMGAITENTKKGFYMVRIFYSRFEVLYFKMQSLCSSQSHGYRGRSTSLVLIVMFEVPSDHRSPSSTVGLNSAVAQSTPSMTVLRITTYAQSTSGMINDALGLYRQGMRRV